MSSTEYKHTWTFSKDSVFLRFYLWLWDADITRVDFCRLLWGYTFFWVAIIVRIISFPFRAIHSYGEPRGWWKDKPKQRKVINDDTPAKMGEFFANPKVRRVIKIIGIILLVNIGMAALAFLSWIIYLAAPPVYEFIASGELFEEIWHVLTHEATLFLVIWLVSTITLGAAIIWFVKSNIGKRTWQFMKLSFHALKTNTCPKIEVK